MTLRIANAQGFWGDDPDAPSRVVDQEPDLDFVTMDYLAEVSLSIMAAQRERHPEMGYARDCVEAVRSLAPHWRSGGGVRVVTNGGGLNPRGCAEACRRALREEGCRNLRIGVVRGDDVLELVRRLARNGGEGEILNNLENGEPIRTVLDRLVTANAYLGAEGIVKALAAGANIVLTGRVTDSSLLCAPCIHRFGWAPDDYDRVAGGLVAGHILECGVQVTGGISTDWLDVPAPAEMGFPVAEVERDGTFVVTKPKGTGGRVTEETVKEQLLYEIGDPDRYLTPDASVSLEEIDVRREGPDRVRVTGARGGPPPETYKVSATYRDGFRAQGTVTIFGRQAVRKARRCGEMVLARLRSAGWDPEAYEVECLGAGACVPGVLAEPELMETVLRLAVRDSRREAVERFCREVAPLVTSGPQGLTGFSAGRPRPGPVFGYWPCLIPRMEVATEVELIEVE
jgi:hypothetical protein